MAHEALPLAGYRVIEIGHAVAAPYAALILAELGAEASKVERAGPGLHARAWAPPWRVSTPVSAASKLLPSSLGWLTASISVWTSFATFSNRSSSRRNATMAVGSVEVVVVGRSVVVVGGCVVVVDAAISAAGSALTKM